MLVPSRAWQQKSPGSTVRLDAQRCQRQRAEGAAATELQRRASAFFFAFPELIQLVTVSSQSTRTYAIQRHEKATRRQKLRKNTKRRTLVACAASAACAASTAQESGAALLAEVAGERLGRLPDDASGGAARAPDFNVRRATRSGPPLEEGKLLASVTGGISGRPCEDLKCFTFGTRASKHRPTPPESLPGSRDGSPSKIRRCTSPGDQTGHPPCPYNREVRGGVGGLCGPSLLLGCWAPQCVGTDLRNVMTDMRAAAAALYSTC